MEESSLFKQFVAFTASVHQVTSEMTRDIRHEEITPVQYKILEYLAVSEPVTLSEISECMNMSMPNTSREIRKLTEKGFCEKVTDVDDRRKQRIRLSKAGTVLMDNLFAQIAIHFNERLRHVNADELPAIEQAIRLLQKKVFY